MNIKPTILILGKLPPPYMGPAIATKILINSSLKDNFNLLHVNTTINESLFDMGKWKVSKLFSTLSLYFSFIKLLISKKVNLTLIPISQTTMGFLKDAPLIWIASLLSKKNIVQLRGSNFENWLNQSNKITRFFVRITLKQANGVIVLGESLKYLFNSYFNENEIHVIPNGENYQFPEKEASTNIKLLYLGNFLPSKGFKELLSSLQHVSNKNVELIAAGYWYVKEYETECKALIDQLQINISILPPADLHEKLKLLANADIFIFTPIGPEGHPWVIVEAMAAGLPIISSNQGAITESVINDLNGFIIDPKNINEFNDKLQLLINNQDLRIEMGRASKLLYSKKFTREIMIERYKQVFLYYCN